MYRRPSRRNAERGQRLVSPRHIPSTMGAAVVCGGHEQRIAAHRDPTRTWNARFLLSPSQPSSSRGLRPRGSVTLPARATVGCRSSGREMGGRGLMRYLIAGLRPWSGRSKRTGVAPDPLPALSAVSRGSIGKGRDIEPPSGRFAHAPSGGRDWNRPRGCSLESTRSSGLGERRGAEVPMVQVHKE
jgi:hypothetical protein